MASQRLPRPAAAEGHEWRVRGLRLRGQDGRAILPHRSIWRLELPLRRIAGGIALAAALSLGLFALRDTIAAGWAIVLVGWLQALGLPGHFDVAPRGDISWFGIALPLIDLRPLPQHDLALPLHAAATAAAWWLGGRLPDAFRPGGYLLRFAALIHGASVAFFAFRAASFPHSLVGHTAEGLRQAWALMLITPWVHLVTYYLFPVAPRQRFLLTLFTLAWLAAAAPLVYTLHAVLLHHLGLVVMPLLQLLFGVMVLIIGFVALYGWAMSWPDDAGGRGTDAAPARGTAAGAGEAA